MTDQVQRLEALDPQGSFIVSAPAGSGKTGLITQRLLRLLCSVQNPEEILCITFTKKAAAEMSSRVHSALQQACPDSINACFVIGVCCNSRVFDIVVLTIIRNG